ncbi:hypothetical protein QTP70_008518 [Hemibagrus guttatus]|uniref:Uncharacterized protein n=1 Tax=Hemibagrus guttatus TaxID=175788 RepID=A0AAE0V957_9TELE|nr:hypothetical protein QTP70_008518 [Hemibagrus guttatus]
MGATCHSNIHMDAGPKVSQQNIAQSRTLPPPARLLPIVHPGAMCSPEQSPTQSSIPTTSDAQTLYIVLIPVIGGLLLLGSVMVIVVKCRKKRSTQDEPIYYNITHKSKGNPETRQEKGQM